MSALFVWALLFFSAAAPAESVQVAKVVDGDSLRLTDGREIRLIGINAPEYGKDGGIDQPLSRQAQAALTRLTAKKPIRLEYDAERNDRYGRTLAHVFLADGSSVEEALLREGLVFQVVQSPNVGRLGEYHAAETEARRAQRGVWGHSFFKPREAARLETGERGFRFVEGRVQRVGRGPHAVYLDLTEHFTLVIPHDDWHFFGGDPKRFLHRYVTARGWVTMHENRLRMRLSHPIMMELVD